MRLSGTRYRACEHSVLQAQRQHEAVGVMMLDLNRFKSVNDQFGHHAGDFIRACLSMGNRIGDRLVVAGASIGTALFKEDGASCSELIDAADAAMDRAKTQSVAWG